MHSKRGIDAKTLTHSLGEMIPASRKTPCPSKLSLCSIALTTTTTDSNTAMSRVRTLFKRKPLTCSSYRTARQSFRCTHHHAQYADLLVPLPLQSGMRWSYLWYASMLALGITTGLGARQFAAPLGLPEPGSREDAVILESLGQDVDDLEIVKSLRSQSYNQNTDAALRSGPGLTSAPGSSSRKISAYKDWMEVEIKLGSSESEGQNGLLGVMSGTRGFGVQRAFWNAQTREMVAVVWMGGGLSGWPGVAHGGAIATFLEEIMMRMVTAGPEGRVGMYAKLSAICCFVLFCYCVDNKCHRASPPPSMLPQHHVRETHIQPRLLHPPRPLLKPQARPICAAAAAA